MSEAPLPREVVQYLQSLETRVKTLEAKLGDSESAAQLSTSQLEEVRTLLPNSNIISPSFLRRAFTVWGHYFVAQLIIAIPIYCFFFIIIFALGGDIYGG